MVKEQAELKEALAQAKEEARARGKEQAQDEIKFNELYRQRETELIHELIPSTRNSTWVLHPGGATEFMISRELLGSYSGCEIW